MTVEFTQHGRDRPDEHAGVPAKVSLPHKGVSQFRVGFFAETDDPEDVVGRGAVFQRRGRALLDVAETGTGPGRLDPDRDERAGFFRGSRGGLHRFLESGAIFDHVVGRQDHHGRAVITRRDPGRGEGDGRGGVALGRLGHDVFRRQVR